MYANHMFAVLSFAVLLVQVVTAVPNPEKVKFFKDKIELSMLQNEVAKEMSTLTKPLVKPTDTDDTDPNDTKKSCFNDDDTTAESGSLNEWSLRHLINTIAPDTFDEASVSDTTYYAAIDYGRTLEDNSDPLRILWPSSLGLNSQQPPPEKLWLNYPPYKNTSLYLIGKYGESEQKPVIGILGMFGTETLGMAIDQLRCLAKLKFLGFKLRAWDIEGFKTNFNDACSDIVSDALSSNRFAQELENVQDLIQFVTEMSQNPNIQNWCLRTTTLLANEQSQMKMRY